MHVAAHGRFKVHGHTVCHVESSLPLMWNPWPGRQRRPANHRFPALLVWVLWRSLRHGPDRQAWPVGGGLVRPPGRATISPSARCATCRSAGCCAQGEHDHDARDAHPIGSADGDRPDACWPTAHLPPDARAVALGAGDAGAAETPAVSPEPTSYPSRERDAADHDQPYTWGRLASTYLAPREVVRLMILRSRLEQRRDLRNRGRAPRTRTTALQPLS